MTKITSVDPEDMQTPQSHTKHMLIRAFTEASNQLRLPVEILGSKCLEKIKID